METQERSIIDEEIEFLAENYHPIFVSIIGLSGTGKTNLAFIIAKKISEYYGLDRFYFHLKPEKIENKGVHIFDDFTYLVRLNSEIAYKFGRHVQLIRHKFPKHMAIIFISHYVHSMLPIFRMTHIRFLLNLTSRYEIDQLKKYFDLEDLWNFYRVYVTNRLKYRALMNCLGKHYIVKIPLSQLYKDTMVIYDGKIPKEISLMKEAGDDTLEGI